MKGIRPLNHLSVGFTVVNNVSLESLGVWGVIITAVQLSSSKMVAVIS